MRVVLKLLLVATMAAVQLKDKKALGPRVSARQLDLLISFMEDNTQLVRAAVDGSMTPQEKAEKWQAIADNLNNAGPAQKDWKAWRSVWNNKVCEARKHDAELAAAARKTGGGKSYVPPLTPQEERILALAGTDASRGNGRPRPAVLLQAPPLLPQQRVAASVSVLTLIYLHKSKIRSPIIAASAANAETYACSFPVGL